MGIKIKQHDITDCGAVCLASISAHYKLKIPISKIRQYASTDKKGTNVLGLIQAAEKLGFSAKGVKGPIESLSKVPFPCIAHVVVKKRLQHYVVIYNVSDRYITFMDPGDGKMHKYTYQQWQEIWSGVLVLLAPNETFEKKNEKVSIVQRFLFLIRPHKSVFTQALFSALIYTVLGLSVSIYIQKITDHVLIEGNFNLLNLLSIGMIVILILQILFGVLKSIFILRTGQKIDAQLILGYYKHLLTLPQRFFDTMRTGEIISRVSDAVKIRVFINDVFINLFVNVFIVIFSFALMFTYYWKLALVILLIIPFHLIIYLITNALNKKTERRLMENGAELESQLVESLNNVRTIKQFGIEFQTNIKTEDKFVRLLNTTFTSGLNSIFSTNSSEFLNRLFVIVLLWVGAGFVINQQITPGELLSFYALIGYFTSPINGLIHMNKTIQNALIAADRLFEIMDLEKSTDGDTITFTPSDVGDISFHQVDFSYGSRVDVFENLSLVIKKNQHTAIVGESGSGKSTLMGIIQKIYPIQSGSVSIGNFNIDHINTGSLREIVSVVPQNIDLFTGTIIENIALGDFSPNMKRLLAICDSLGISQFIKELPNGYQTLIGEYGSNLSGGQKQRIAIARALYKEPEIIILDEATSAIDSLSEWYVQETIQDLQKMGKTIISITHRLSSTMGADNIIVMDRGTISELGCHDQLLKQKGKYFELWNHQVNKKLGLSSRFERTELTFQNGKEDFYPELIGTN